MKEIIRIDKGVTRHPDRRMAEPVSLSILVGEQIAIVGDNAAGKSRLVDLITSRFPLLGDEVNYDFGPKAHALVSDNIKYISFQDSYGDSVGMYYYQQRWNQHDIEENTPTLGNILEQSSKLHATARSMSCEQLCQLFKLENQLDKYIISLSSGELRKVQLIKALMGAPRVLILDNPYIGLDASTRQVLTDLLSSLIQELQLTIILVLSRCDEIPDFITHVLPVKELRLEPKQTRSAYKTLSPVTPALPHQEQEWILNFPSEQPYNLHQQGCILRLRQVSIQYGARVILSHLDWEVHEGERWALSGENGAGKSTLLSLICADNPQSYACDIQLFERQRGSGESIWEIKRHIGYVSPEMHRAYLKNIPAIDIVASGLNDTVGLYNRPRPEQRESCMRWLQVFGIAELADRNFLQLSSGEQRLCLLARAFVKDPELLILDEPLHGLDAQNCARVQEIIDTFCQRPHKTLIMVTHYQNELPQCITHHLYLTKN
ncbi:MAG: ATP-binding cassette domain-containing protein [Bacteroidaceae bacterium]|nr:ATP-binding cassette domain-containing protein [Bacteroidaceae bacterium]